jgi:hypothetical protein
MAALADAADLPSIGADGGITRARVARPPNLGVRLRKPADWNADRTWPLDLSS